MKPFKLKLGDICRTPFYNLYASCDFVYLVTKIHPDNSAIECVGIGKRNKNYKYKHMDYNIWDSYRLKTVRERNEN